MRKLMTLLIMLLVLPVLVPLESVFAQKPQPSVPITYGGDTENTIARRAQWMEGAKKEGVLSFWTSTTPADVNQIATEFNKIYPFIKIEHWRGQDVERDTKLETQHTSGRVAVDIFDVGAMEQLPRWRKMGMFEKFVDFVPGMQKWDKRMYSRFGDWVAPEHMPKAPFYNTNVVPPSEAPKKWEDLLDPKWKGHLGMTPDMRVWCILALDEKGWGVGKTEQFLKGIKQQQPIWAAGHSAGLNLLLSGEYKIMAENSIRYIYRAKEKPPADWVKSSPVAVTIAPYVLAKKAPHPNAARLFMEWFLSPQGLAVNERVTWKGAVFPGAGTRQAKLLEGFDLTFLNEDLVLKAAELGLIDKFANILGVTPKAD